MKTVLLGALAALVATVGVTAAQAYDRRVNIINNTGYAIREFYASNTGARTWEEDILGRDILPAGYEVVVNIDDRSGYCKFDFLAVFEDGEEVITPGVNVCEVGEFTYND
jgi:hypothetical protein